MPYFINEQVVPRKWVGMMMSVLATWWTSWRSNPSGGATFSALVQTGPRAHSASCKVDTGPLVWVKRPERGI